MTYVSVVTLVAYGLLIAVLVAVAVKDWRTRRIPNGMVGLLGLLWVVWRCVLGFAGKHMGLGFWSTLLSPAPEVLGRIGLPIYGVSLSGGVLGALVLGGGMLVLSAAYELVTKRESFGGGDWFVCWSPACSVWGMLLSLQPEAPATISPKARVTPSSLARCPSPPS